MSGPEAERAGLELARTLLANQDSLGLDLGTKSSERVAAVLPGYALGGSRADPRILISRVILGHLDVSAKLALWWSKDGFHPAVYCQNKESAMYVKALLSLRERRGLAVCPHPGCGVAFQQKRPDQQYCSIAHREAHRVARWRMTPQGQRAVKRQIERRVRQIRKKSQARRATRGAKR